MCVKGNVATAKISSLRRVEKIVLVRKKKSPKKEGRETFRRDANKGAREKGKEVFRNIK